MLRKRILTNTFINFSGKLFPFFLQLFIITYLIKSLGNDAYGILVLALALVGNTNLLEAGFGLAVTKYVAEYKAKDDLKRLLEVVNTNLLVTTILAFTICTVLLIINELFLEKIFKIPYDLISTTKNLIRILLLFSLVEFWSIGIIRVAEGFQRYSLIRGIELLKWFLRAVFIVIAIEGGYGIVGVGIAYLGSGIVNLGTLYLFVFIRAYNLRLGLRFSSMESFKLLYGFSIWIFLSKAFAFIAYKIDTIILGIFLPPVNITYYNIAFKIYEVLNYGFSLITSTLLPVTSEIDAAMDKEKLSILFKKASKYTVILMYPIIAFSFFYADDIIRLWLGSGFNTSVLLSKLLIAPLFFTALVFCGIVMMVGINKVKALIKYSGVASIINLIISVILVQKIGVYGVAIGTLIGTVIITIGYIHQMIREFRFSLLFFLNAIVLKPALLTIILSVIFIVFKNMYVGLLWIVIYFLVAFIFVIDKDDKKSVLKLVKSYIYRISVLSKDRGYSNLFMNYSIIKENIEIKRMCPVCNSERHVPISEVYIKNLNFFTTSYCANCGFVFRSIRPNISWFQYNWAKRKNIVNENEYSFSSALEQKRYKRYKNLAIFFERISEKRSILDIGSGPGTGLRAFKDFGWNVKGFEPDPSRAMIAIQQHGINIIKDLNGELPESYDFATLIQTLEHIHDPYNFLRGVVKLVKRGGYVYIEVPDLLNFINWRDALYLEHMNNFTLETLNYLCSRVNLILRYQIFPKTHPFGATHIGALFEKVEHLSVQNLNSSGVLKNIFCLYTRGLPRFKSALPIKYHVEEIDNLAITTNNYYPKYDKINNFFLIFSPNSIIAKLRQIILRIRSTDGLKWLIMRRLSSYFPLIFKDDDFENLKVAKIEV